MIDYIQKYNMIQARYSSDVIINKSLEKQITVTSYSFKTTICYIKRQILIIYHVLDKILESWWVTNPPNRKVRPITPPILMTDFKPAYQIMKIFNKNKIKFEYSDPYFKKIRIGRNINYKKKAVTQGDLEMQIINSDLR